MNDQAFSADEQGVKLSIHLQPNAKQTQLAGRHGGALKLKVQAPPVAGAANKAAVKFLARIFGVAKSQIKLLRGQTSREKVFLIRDVSLSQAAEILQEHEA